MFKEFQSCLSRNTLEITTLPTSHKSVKVKRDPETLYFI